MGEVRTIQNIIEQRYSRRDLLKRSLKVMGAGATTAVLSGCTETEFLIHSFKNYMGESEAMAAYQGSYSSLGFQEIRKGIDEDHHLATGYNADVLASWGDPVVPGAPAFDPKAQRGADQARQFGFNNDFTMYFPLTQGDGASEHGLLCVNHEYVLPHLMHPGLTATNARLGSTAEQLRIEQEAVGVSVMEVKRFASGWDVVKGRYGRRITATTPIQISGPAAGHARMRTKADPSGRKVLGTFANCAGGITPWGTYLTCEENMDGFFTKPKSGHPEMRNYSRMTIGDPQYTSWHRLDSRFDTNKEPNEANRFGWVVEIDPYAPESAPVKRTALGRFKHESASCYANPDGRVIVYSGCDSKFEYVYRYVSNERMSADREQNKRLLDDGTLYAALFKPDGRLQWLPLIFGIGPLNPKNGFHSQADVLIEARRAADLVGATPMDRPEDVEVNPKTGKLYIVMTKNSSRDERQADPANPRARNIHGHIIEVSAEIDGHINHATPEHRWDMFMMAGNPYEPTDFALYQGQPSPHGWLSCPDNMAFDAQGRMWLTTDGQPKSVGFADGVFACDTEGEGRGVTRHFLRGPKGCELTGPSFTPNGKTMFVAVQHPGDTSGSNFDNPSTRWPQFDPAMPPRPSVLAVTKSDGGVIGS